MEIDDPWFAIANRIRAERVRCGLTSTELARRVDVSRTTIHNWEGGRPIPIERCAALAEALEVEHQELLRLHPHAASGDATIADPEPQSGDSAGNRLLLAGAGAIVALVFAAAFAVWHVSSGDCLATGAGGGSMLGPFEQTYEDLGGRRRLGCAVEEVKRQGAAVVQQFEDGMLIAFDDDHAQVFLIAEDILEDYSAIAETASSHIVGTFATDVRVCGEARIVVLGGGWGESAMVEVVDGQGFLWLNADLWAAYINVGGPLGPLGLPVVGSVERTDGGERVQFGGGAIERRYGGAPIIDTVAELTGVDRLDVSSCGSTTTVDEGSAVQ